MQEISICLKITSSSGLPYHGVGVEIGLPSIDDLDGDPFRSRNMKAQAHLRECSSTEFSPCDVEWGVRNRLKSRESVNAEPHSSGTRPRVPTDMSLSVRLPF